MPIHHLLLTGGGCGVHHVHRGNAARRWGKSNENRRIAQHYSRLFVHKVSVGSCPLSVVPGGNRRQTSVFCPCRHGEKNHIRVLPDSRFHRIFAAGTNNNKVEYDSYDTYNNRGASASAAGYDARLRICFYDEARHV